MIQAQPSIISNTKDNRDAKSHVQLISSSHSSDNDTAFTSDYTDADSVVDEDCFSQVNEGSHLAKENCLKLKSEKEFLATSTDDLFDSEYYCSRNSGYPSSQQSAYSIDYSTFKFPIPVSPKVPQLKSCLKTCYVHSPKVTAKTLSFFEKVRVIYISSDVENLEELWYSFAEIQQFERETYGLDRQTQGCKKSRNNNKKAVRFCSILNVTSIPSAKNSLNSDSLWYSAGEIGSFEMDAVRELKQSLQTNNQGKVRMSYREWLNFQ